MCRKFATKYADLDFVTAPHLIPATNEEDQVEMIF